MSVLRVALCGNPNVGKSTVFNALTGLRQHTGNWAGKTVESAVGRVRGRQGDWQLIDLPGSYSLLSGSPEEVVASDYLTFEPLDAVIVVLDATCLKRQLALALQVAQANPRTLVCLNLMDQAQKRGIHIDTAALEKRLGLPVAAVCARSRRGLHILKERVWDLAISPKAPHFAASPRLPPPVEQAVRQLSEQWQGLATMPRFAALRGLISSPDCLLQNVDASNRTTLAASLAGQRKILEQEGFTEAQTAAAIAEACYRETDQVLEGCVQTSGTSPQERRQLQADRLLASKWLGIPLMLCLLGLVLALSLYGANLPSQWLTRGFAWLAPKLRLLLQGLHPPVWLLSLLMDGVYRVTTWVVAVMLPPMAIFFPLFTLLEDWGLLPRIAFNLDKCFQCCHACGKQALCMCMGLGCNAVGVTGCRIIQSPRERLIAILTNALMPCNGRFPTLMTLITLFVLTGNGPVDALLGAAVLCGVMVLCVLATLLLSRLLSVTLLKGLPSAFALELPPFRRPKIGEVAVRSLLDRTLFVLGRAVSVAAPAGLCVWILANVQVNGVSLLLRLAQWLEPAGRFLGMDGAILLAFVLGFPANEIVLPILLMIYLNRVTLVDTGDLQSLRALLEMNGWTLRTALCVILFSLFHWPCSTTLWTIRKETGRWRWVLAAALLPTLLGCLACHIVGWI